jgi:hypothetical protein
VEALFHDEGFITLQADLALYVKDKGSAIIHGIPKNEVDVAEQNFLRGKISAFEDLIELAEEYKEWKERDKR